MTAPTQTTADRRAYLDRRAEAAIQDYKGLFRPSQCFLALVHLEAASDRLKPLDEYEAAIADLEGKIVQARQSAQDK